MKVRVDRLPMVKPSKVNMGI